MMLLEVLKNFVTKVTNSINMLQQVVYNLEKYVGVKESDDPDSLTYKIDHLIQTNYKYELQIDDLLIEQDSDGNYYVTLDSISGAVYIKIYTRPSSGPVEQVEIENEDYTIEDERVVIDSSIIDYIGISDDLYAKVTYIKKIKIDDN